MSEENSSAGGGPRRSLGLHMFYGSAWMIILRWSIRFTGLISTIILARVLMPSDFGIVAMAMFVVGMLELLNQSGQKLAIIRHPSPNREDYDTAWTLSVLFGFVIAALIVASAPLAATYFHEPRVAPVMQCLALRSILGGFENIGVTDFKRDLRFDRFFYYSVYPRIITFIITIPLAFILRNYWALVVGIISSQVTMNILSYSMHPYRPRFGLTKLAHMWSFSIWTLIRVVGNYFSAQIDEIFVGGLLGSSAMGRYSVASDVASSPSKEITEPMVTALYPVMARARSDQEALRHLYMRSFSWSAVICFSTALGVLMVAHDLVHFLLGGKWTNVEPLIGWLALSGGLLGMTIGAYTTFDALGKPEVGAQMQWVRLAILILALVPVGLILRDMSAIAIARCLVTALFMPTLLSRIGREINVSTADYFYAMWRPALAAAFMCGILYLMNMELTPGNLRLAGDVLLGVACFATVLGSLWWLSGRPKGPERDIQDFILGLFFKAKLRLNLAR